MMLAEAERILMRHGESDYNIRRTTHLDSDLTLEGLAQCRQTAEFLSETIPHLSSFVGLVSPYFRTLRSAEVLADLLGVSFWVVSGLREYHVDYAITEVPLYQQRFPNFIWPELEMPLPRQWYGLEGWIFKQETVTQFEERMRVFATTLDVKHNYLLVSHGTPVTSLAEILTNPGDYRSQQEYYASNCGLYYVRGTEMVWDNRTVYERVEV